MRTYWIIQSVAKWQTLRLKTAFAWVSALCDGRDIELMQDTVIAYDLSSIMCWLRKPTFSYIGIRNYALQVSAAVISFLHEQDFKADGYA